MSIKFLKSYSLAVLLLLTVFCGINQGQTQKKYYVVGYLGAFGSPINVDQIEAKKLTHINYAFANCKDSMAVFDNIKNDTANLRKLNSLKKINPNLKVLISVGGGSRSRFFSDAVLTPTSRVLFTKSCIDMVRKYDLDGLDIDWEYPGQRGGNNNVFREVEDKRNFTLMWIELRKELDKLTTQTGRKYWLTGAFNVSKAYTDHVELSEVAKYMDFINLMTYDFSGPNSTVGHHTNLYNYGPLGPRSADKGIRDYISMGVPPEKLLPGVAFYSRGVRSTTTKNNGLGEPRAQLPAGTTIPAGGYSRLKDSVVNRNGYKRYWDNEARAPYLFNSENMNFITYDDEESTRLKARYAKTNNLAGVFFWQYFSDPKGYLLEVLNQELPH
jgi:chitinase